MDDQQSLTRRMAHNGLRGSLNVIQDTLPVLLYLLPEQYTECSQEDILVAGICHTGLANAYATTSVFVYISHKSPFFPNNTFIMNLLRLSKFGNL
jgi:hypothetical protein